MPSGYTPIYQITRGGVDITGQFSDRCVSIRVDFSAGDGEEDSCVIILDDRDFSIARPTEGETISIFMGYAEVGMASMGSYTIEQVKFSGLPKAITLTGTASGSENAMKVQINQEFKGKTLGELFEAMAKKGGLSAEVHPDLKGMKGVDFRNMLGSPHTMIQQLARQFNAIAKIANGKLQVVPRDKGENSSGEQMPTIVLGPAHFGSWEVTHDQQPSFSKVRASYVDQKDYTTKFVDAASQAAGGMDLPFTINRKFNSKEEAQAAADAQMKTLQQSLGTIDLVLAKGDPWIHDQQRILIRGMRDGVNGSYVSEIVSHTYVKDQGISTQIHGKPPADAADYEVTFDRASDEEARRLFLDPGPGNLIGTVIDRYITGRAPTVDEIIGGIVPF